MRQSIRFAFVLLRLTTHRGWAQKQLGVNLNTPEREPWLKDAGFSMFIHGNTDTQLGVVISHSLVGASPDCTDRYLRELPKTVYPKDRDPERLVILAKNADMKYGLLRTRHHAGFCLWNAKTTDFSLMNAPYKKNIIRQYVGACRNGMNDITRAGHWEKAKPFQARFKTFVEAQYRELITNYGPVDLFFIGSDGLRAEVKATAWKYQPYCRVTREALKTPEQYMPGETLDRPGESYMTMGTVWHYKPTNDGQTRFEQTADGLKVLVVRAQRIYNNHKWPNPIVRKLTNVTPAVEPILFRTMPAEKLPNGNLKLPANVLKISNDKQYRPGFAYRPVPSSLNEDSNQPWTLTDVYPVSQTDKQRLELVADTLKTYDEIECPALLIQDGLSVDGNALSITKLRLE